MRLKDAILNPEKVIFAYGIRGGFRFLNDEKYLRLMYRCKMGKKLNLDNPKSYNEKLQWLKIHERNPLYTKLVDKYEVKKYVAEIIGEEYVIPTIGVWNSFDEIDFEKLPSQFVLKCTHDSGGLVICQDKEKLDRKRAKKKIEKSLKRNYYWAGREWPYKDVVPRIIAEQYMQDKDTNELRDYKFFVFNGNAKILFVASERQSRGEETKFDFYDMNFKHLEFINGHPNSKNIIEKPVTFDKMYQFSEKLAHGIPHVRVDFYEVDGKVYFGEMTFSHWSGLMPFEPELWDYKIGDWLTIPD